MKLSLVFAAFIALYGCTNITEERKTMFGDDEFAVAGDGGKEAKKAWQGFGDLITGNTDKTAFMQADFEEPGYYTVQFGIDPPVGVGGAQSASLSIATIEWSVEGNTMSRQVTVGNGVSISGPAQGVKVVVRDATTGGFGALGQPYKVFMQVTRGTRPSENQPVTLMGLTATPAPGGAIAVSLGPGAFATWLVPQQAGAISYSITAADSVGNASPNAKIAQSNGVAGLKVYKYSDSQVDGFVSLAPNATQVAFTNSSAADIYTVSLTWGIDG